MSDRRSFLGSLLALTAAPLAKAETKEAPEPADPMCSTRTTWKDPMGHNTVGVCTKERGHEGRHRAGEAEWPCGVATRTVACIRNVGHAGQHFGQVVGLSKDGKAVVARELHWS